MSSNMCPICKENHNLSQCPRWRIPEGLGLALFWVPTVLIIVMCYAALLKLVFTV